ncbi:MAG: hypothetical protein ACKVZJ_06815 [Phycisphaerales bacterium]
MFHRPTARRGSPATFFLLATLVTLLPFWGWGAAALARQSDPEPEAEVTSDLGAGSMTAGPDAANQIITIEAEQFGVGDMVRESDWCGLSLILSDPTSDKARNVAVRVAIKDDDGDTQYATRTLALSMATRVRTWLYFRVPKQFQQGSVVTVSVHELDADAPTAEDGDIQVGRQLSYTRLASRNVLGSANLGPTMGLMGVVGRRTFRLDQYRLPSPEGGTMNTAHEATEVVTGLTPEALPDSWVGLAPYEVLLWTEGGPERLEDSRRQALREWVHRGGHLIVALPPVGSTWFAPSNPLLDILPACKVRRQEDQSLEPYRALLTNASPIEEKLPEKTVVQSFEADPPDSASSAFTEVLSGPNGCVAARRIVGAGMVTVIGLDLGAGRLPNGVLAADSFWHRIIGRRFDIPTGDRAKGLSQGGLLGMMGSEYVDGYVGPEIAKQRAAGVGVLMGLLVFAAYWFAAGPGGFALLKWKKSIQHAWVGFVIASLVFTAVAWAGATALRPRKVEAQHLTYLTHVYGQPVQSARVWASVLLPEYGSKTVSIGRPDADVQWRQALTGWSEPIGNTKPTPFPDARGYSVDVRKLQVSRVPARATIRQFQGDWLGGPMWTMPGPPDPADAPRLRRSGGTGDAATLELSGKLVHKLPGELSNVKIIVVTGQSTDARAVKELRAKSTGVMPSTAYAWAMSQPWKPGEVIDFGVREYSFNIDASFEKFMLNTSPRGDITSLGGTSVPSSVGPRTADYHVLASLYSLVPQPEWSDTSGISNTKRVPNLRRHATQGLDLSKWFTQPCIIVIGQIEKGPSPVPMSVDGETVPTEGRTVVRWVFPLASSPPKFGGMVVRPGTAGPGSGGPKEEER